MAAHHIQLSTDVKNAYFNGRVNPMLIVKLFLISAIATFFIGATILFFGISMDNHLITGALLIGLSLLIIIPLGRSFLWNAFGEEHVVINADSLVYQHNFGFSRTNEKTIVHNGTLSFDFEITNYDEKEKEGVLHIFEQGQNDSYTKLYSTAMRLTEEQAKEFIHNVESVFKQPNCASTFEFSLN